METILNKESRAAIELMIADGIISKDTAERYFPELKESGDEKIRKAIYNCVEWFSFDNEFLEKQGEQTPKFRVGDTIKCKHDDRRFTIKSVDLEKGTYTYTQEGCGNDIDYADEEFELVEQKPVDKVEPFNEYEGLTDFERTLADICIGWIGEELGWKQYIKDNADVLLKIAAKKFNSVQDAPFEQKAAWSEEDEEMLNSIVARLHSHPNVDLEEYSKECNWLNYILKSLKPQNRWKPNLAQLNALSIVSKGNITDDIEAIVSLYNDLKKLREE